MIKTKSNVKSTPEVKPVLGKDQNGPERQEDWHYRSIIGMLTFLSACTHPEIEFSVHQCARFSNTPMKIHEQAVKRIIRYLLGTINFDDPKKDKGLIMNPNRQEGMIAYVDADFAGGWSKEDSDEPTTVMSRTGFIINYMNCPIRWVSKLQSEIALSTTEAEYIALSQSMREIIPLMTMIEHVNKIFGIETQKPKVLCTLFEDNNGALELEKAPKFRPRTKHIALKYHHFREHVRKVLAKILPIDTKEQVADIFTKPLLPEPYQYLRKMIMGW